jgi:hypothetical protein
MVMCITIGICFPDIFAIFGYVRLDCPLVGYGISRPEDKRANPLNQSDYGVDVMITVKCEINEEFEILAYGNFSKTDISCQDMRKMLLPSFGCSQMDPVICSIKEE